MYYDSFKLVRLRWVAITILFGGASAALSYVIHLALSPHVQMDFTSYSRYVAPVVEEMAKSLVAAYLIRSGRTGFLVDAAIFGFAAGTGFALVENGYYLESIPEIQPAVWLIRGFGTAVMHGGTTAIFAITSQLLAERRSARDTSIFVPGFLLAVVLHSLFNHLVFSPVFSTIVILLACPLLIFIVFSKSETSLKNWLEVGFDADTELLELIRSGRVSESKAGRFLQSLKDNFSGEVVVDLLCYLRIHLELSLHAKGMLMLREAGFDAEPDDESRALLAELEYLEKSIGKTGRLAMTPFLRMSAKELWQMYVLRV